MDCDTVRTPDFLYNQMSSLPDLIMKNNTPSTGKPGSLSINIYLNHFSVYFEIN